MNRSKFKKSLLALSITALIIISLIFSLYAIRYVSIFSRKLVTATCGAFLDTAGLSSSKTDSKSNTFSGSAQSGSESDEGIPPDSAPPEKIQMPSGFIAYHYNRLTDIQKKLYDSVLYAVYNAEPYCVITDMYEDTDVDLASDAVVLDHPELFFYFRGSIEWYNWNLDNDLVTVKIVFKYLIESKDEIEKMRLEQDNAIDKIITSVIKPGHDDYTKEILIHNWLIENCEYDYDAYEKAKKDKDYYTLSYSPYNAIINGKGLCGAYTGAMQMLLSEIGIGCIYVSGRTTGSEGEEHAWNIVQINGNYYQVDVTYDDCGKKTKYLSQVTYQFFNITDSDMNDRVYDEGLDYPDCTTTLLNYYIKNGLYIESNDDTVDLIADKMIEKISAGQLGCEFRFGPDAGGYTDDEFNDMLDLVEKELVKTKINGKIYYVDLYWYEKGDDIFALKCAR